MRRPACRPSARRGTATPAQAPAGAIAPHTPAAHARRAAALKKALSATPDDGGRALGTRPFHTLGIRNFAMTPRHLPALLALGIALAGFGAAACAATPADLLAGYRTAAGRAPDPAQGALLFGTPQGREWSCSSCHGKPPTGEGRHASTGKPIAALAPAANGARFTDAAKAEKWFRRNCNDVLGRECSAGEKADLLAWLMSLRP